MRILFYVSAKNLGKVNEIISKDPIARLSLTLRDNRALGVMKEGNYLLIQGDEEICTKAKEEIKEFAQELTGKEKEEIIKKMLESERAAMHGFGNIFG